MCGIAQKRRDIKNFLQATEQCAMGIVDGTAVALPFRERRQNDHPDRAIGSIGLIPGDENRSALAIRLRIQNLGEDFRKPFVALRDLVISWSATVVHVIP